MSEFADTCLAYINLKEALLYFKHVVSLSNLTARHDRQAELDYWRKEGIPARETTGAKKTRTMTQAWLPPGLAADAVRKEFLKDISEVGRAEIKMLYPRNCESSSLAKEPLAIVLARFIEKHRLNHLPVFAAETICQGLLRGRAMFFSLTNVPLVNLAGTSYEQIEMLREDKGAQAAMRSFRLFAYDDYENNDSASVENALQQKLHDYLEAASKHGLALRQKSISFLLRPELFAAGMMDAFLPPPLKSSEVMFETIVAAASAMPKICFELGSLKFELKKQDFTLWRGFRENPVTYVVDARENLKLAVA